MFCNQFPFWTDWGHYLLKKLGLKKVWLFSPIWPTFCGMLHHFVFFACLFRNREQLLLSLWPWHEAEKSNNDTMSAHCVAFLIVCMMQGSVVLWTWTLKSFMACLRCIKGFTHVSMLKLVKNQSKMSWILDKRHKRRYFERTLLRRKNWRVFSPWSYWRQTDIHQPYIPIVIRLFLGSLHCLRTKKYFGNKVYCRVFFI